MNSDLLTRFRERLTPGAAVVVHDASTPPRFGHIEEALPAFRWRVSFETGEHEEVSSLLLFPVFRASARALYHCPASYTEELGAGAAGRAGSEATSSGSAAHYIDERLDDYPDGLTTLELRTIALRFGVSASDARFLEALLRRYRERCANFEEALGWAMERERRYLVRLESGAFLACKPDIVAFSPSGDEAAIEDVKSGHALYPRPEENFQSLAYVSAVFASFPSIQRVTFRFAQPRFDDELDGDTTTFTRGEWVSVIVPAIEARIEQALSRVPEHVVGAHCKYCNGRLRCPALRPAIVDALTGDATPLDEMDDEERTAFAEIAVAAEAFAKSARDAIDAFVRTRGGSVELRDGRAFRLVDPKRPRRDYDLRELSHRTDLAALLRGSDGTPWGLLIEREKKTAPESALVDLLCAAERRDTGAKRIIAARKAEIASAIYERALELGAVTETSEPSLRLVASPKDQTAGDVTE